MKKKIATILTAAVIGATTLTSCTPAVAASETETPEFTDGAEFGISEINSAESVEETETGCLYNFSDGTGYYIQYHEDIPGLQTKNGYYPLTGIVTEINYEVEPEVDEVTITCANGNRFSWYADSSDCWELFDLASCIMYANGTKRVYDDEVVLAQYAGGLKHFEEIQKGDK